MIRLHDCGGEVILVPETEEERLAMRPEAKLRALFAGDVDGMQRFHDRLRDLDARFSEWKRMQPHRAFWQRWGWLIVLLAAGPRAALQEIREPRL